MDRFYILKEKFVARLEEAKKKGEADEPIYHVLDFINSLDNYFTTSSCAGRITLMSIGKDRKKYNSKFLFKTHYKTKYEPLWSILQQEYKNHYSIWFKMEGFILHVAARTLNHAIKMLKIAQISGFKHSGIISVSDDRVMIEINDTERIETIISKNGELLVDRAYLKVLVNEANEKLDRTRNRIEVFYNNLQKIFS